MLARFSLYGFLKNQRYFEPFLFLALLAADLDFTRIGLCIGARELCLNLAEIPSGAVADVQGRRRAMVGAFVAYTVGLVIFALSTRFGGFLLAMMLWGLGDAFRSGTHKAMILDWLRSQGRAEERTAVYGYTRSWSKLGSAASVVIGTGIVLATGSYRWLFWLTVVPYVLNIVNLATYPAALDGEGTGARGPREVVRHLREAGGHVLGSVRLRGLIAEGMVFQGVYGSIKDYLQPVLKQAALASPLLLAGLDDRGRTAVLVGAVYVVLFLVSAWSSRRAHGFAALAPGLDAAALRLWWLASATLGGVALGLWTGSHALAAAGFVVLALLQNVFRPILVSRFDEHSDPRFGATVLSVESQASSVASIVLAPTIGFAVDQAGALWPVGLIALGLAMVMTLVRSATLR